MTKEKKSSPMPEDTFNGNYSAIPTAADTPNIVTSTDQNPDAVEFGDMNEEDAVESGYTDKNGNAVSSAKPDVEGHPTGAYTDIGAGRSSVVHRQSEKSKKENLH